MFDRCLVDEETTTISHQKTSSLQMFNHLYKISIILLAGALQFSLGSAPVLNSVGFLEVAETVEFEDSSLESIDATCTRRLTETKNVSSARETVGRQTSPQRAKRYAILTEHSRRNGIGAPLRM